MSRFQKKAIKLGSIGLEATGQNPKTASKKKLFYTGIGIMAAMSLGVFFKGLV